jgi:hypothetical protein
MYDATVTQPQTSQQLSAYIAMYGFSHEVMTISFALSGHGRIDREHSVEIPAYSPKMVGELGGLELYFGGVPVSVNTR